MSSFRTRPRPAGVDGILKFLFSACGDARGYDPENHQQLPTFRTRPRPAGGKRNFSNSSFSACGTHAGTSSENNWYVADAGPPRSGGPPACCAAAYAPPNRAHGCPDRGRRVVGPRRARRRTDDCPLPKNRVSPSPKKRKDAAEAAPFAGAVLSRRIRRGPLTS